ncbi:MAG TPA: hypothetical protein VH573_18930 [Mycobacteriales bacterium]
MATGTDGQRATVGVRRRRSRVQVALSAVAVLIVAGGALLAARALTGSGGASAGKAVPAELTIKGKTVHREDATPIVWVQATDRGATTLLVLAGNENRTGPDPCHPWTDVRLVGQDDRTVTLAATTYVDRSGGSNVACAGDGRAGGRFLVHLARPLGTRQVVQDGRDVRVLLTDTRLHATVLPDGYADHPTVEDDPQAPGLTRSVYSGPDQDTYLEVMQGPAGQPGVDPKGPGPIQVLARSTVRGHPAVFRQYPRFDDARCLVWTETARTGVAVCSHGMPAPLTAAQLATVAEGLVRSR